MATIRYTLTVAVVLLMLGFTSCTKYEYIDTGVSNGVHDCTMWDYFHTDSYNWDSTILMIERAGLKPLFDGTGQYKQITFFGLTNLSIERHIKNHNKRLKPTDADYWHGVNSIPRSQCKDILEKLVVPVRFMRADVPLGKRTQQAVGGQMAWTEKGGMVCQCVRGNLFVWTLRGSFGDVEEAGAYELHIASHNQEGTDDVLVVSTDIQTTNGVVHALTYNFQFTNF